MQSTENFSLYYQVKVEKADTWFLTATLRSFEHLTFDRTLNKEQGIFEFFVPVHLESFFLELMDYYQECGFASGLVKLPNRLADPDAQL